MRDGVVIFSHEVTILFGSKYSVYNELIPNRKKKQMPPIVTLIAIVFLFLCLVSFIAGVLSLRKRRVSAGSIGLLVGLLFLSLAALFATVGISIHGYRALTYEEVAAKVRIEPVEPGKFSADFRFPDGRSERFELSGDEFYVDAHILKWKAIANFFGLHTVYELDRVAGRYTRLEDERSKPRTVFSLGRTKPLDMFNLRMRYSFLKPLVDAEYGSASFVPAKNATELEIRVSTTGLLIRNVDVQ